jgi:hypothetical protein
MLLDENHLRDFWHGVDMAGMEKADTADAEAESESERESDPEASVRPIDGGDNDGYDDPDDPDAIEPISDDPDGGWGVDGADGSTFAEEDSVYDVEVDDEELQELLGLSGEVQTTVPLRGRVLPMKWRWMTWETKSLVERMATRSQAGRRTATWITWSVMKTRGTRVSVRATKRPAQYKEGSITSISMCDGSSRPWRTSCPSRIPR